MESKRRVVCLKQETTYVLHSRLGTISLFYFLSLPAPPSPPPPYRGRSYLIFLVRTTEDCLSASHKKRQRLPFIAYWGRGDKKNGISNFIFGPTPPVTESSWFELDHVTNYCDMVSGTQNHVTPHRQSRWRRTGSSSVLLFLDQHHGKKLALIHQKTQSW